MKVWINLANNKKIIKIVKNGPFLVSGDIPLVKLAIKTDKKGYPSEWIEKGKYPLQKEYALCRCGHSKNKPYCDGNHEKIRFEGTETAGQELYINNVKEMEGPDLLLTDNYGLCNHAGFCDRAGGIGYLVRHSDDHKSKKTAIKIAGNCNSGRFVVWDKETGNPMEPNFEPSIAITEEPEKGVSGPLWVRGEISIKSADETVYEIRNRVTLCRCGESSNKPFCDGTHIMTDFNDKE
jgi:CDGSH-type Zn-finger protein